MSATEKGHHAPNHNRNSARHFVREEPRRCEPAIETLTGTSGQVIPQTIEDWIYPPIAFDLVLARLVLYYIADLAPVFTNVLQTLVTGGQFVFSVEHPVITFCDRGWIDGMPRQDWVVDNYFSTGVRINN
jgi:SAM-dependent methyltransferase